MRLIGTGDGMQVLPEVAEADARDDERVLEELIEESLDRDLRQSDEFHAIVDSLADEIEKRFAALDVGDPEAYSPGMAVNVVMGVG